MPAPLNLFLIFCLTRDAQLTNYLKATGIEVGLLINFAESVKVKRKVFDRSMQFSEGMDSLWDPDLSRRSPEHIEGAKADARKPKEKNQSAKSVKSVPKIEKTLSVRVSKSNAGSSLQHMMRQSAAVIRKARIPMQKGQRNP